MSRDERNQGGLGPRVSGRSQRADDVAELSERIGQLVAGPRDGDLAPCREDDLARAVPAFAESDAHTMLSPLPRRARHPVLIVVEDEANDFMLLKRALWKAGATARVWWAHDAREALSLLAELQSSTNSICVVCDVRLLGPDGFELLERIRGESPECRVKFAFLTGMCDRATERRARAQGAHGFFIKPSDPADLVSIARALQKLALE